MPGSSSCAEVFGDDLAESKIGKASSGRDDQINRCRLKHWASRGGCWLRKGLEDALIKVLQTLG